MKLDLSFQIKDSFGKILGKAYIPVVSILENIPNDNFQKTALLAKKLVINPIIEVDEIDFKLIKNMIGISKNRLPPVTMDQLIRYLEETETKEKARIVAQTKNETK